MSYVMLYVVVHEPKNIQKLSQKEALLWSTKLLAVK